MKYCQFIGSVRSGHNLVGQILNAHPDAIIAHEGNVFILPRENLLKNIRGNAKKYYERGCPKYKDENYLINENQAGSKNPKVIGDSYITTKEFFLGVKQFEKDIGLEIKLIWMMRDPVQQIIAKEILAKKLGAKIYSIAANIETYKRQWRYAQELCKMYDFKYMFLTKLVNNPIEEIKSLYEYFDLDHRLVDLENISKKVYEKERVRECTLTDKEIELIKPEINHYENLAAASG